MKSIPISKIDALIAESIKRIEKVLTWNLDINEQRWELSSVLENLRGLEKEARFAVRFQSAAEVQK